MSQEITTKRVCDLEKKDIFKWCSVWYKVVGRSDYKINYALIDKQGNCVGEVYSFGRRNQMKVEIIPVTNPRKTPIQT